ncbi:lytic polysaccharide monooxygenase [Xylariaceae sp. FL0255]|nr:lytic polysaccharide monooxygenase [Xylariaceae sp. FL0255]
MWSSLAMLLAPSLVAAHGAVTSYIIDGTTYQGYQGYSPVAGAQIIQRQWPSYNPILSVSDPMMTCNGGTSAPIYATMAAGDNITAVWAQWTHQQGPVMVWMYACPNGFSDCDGKSDGWFKIDQLGFYGTGSLDSTDWGTAIVEATLKWTSTIPKNLKAGFYLIRHELLALHQADTPQFYPECAQLQITGSGTGVPSGSSLTPIPAYASADSPSIMVDIYTGNLTSYTCPGPDVWTG